ncbi:MAG: hypothetical protein P8182_18695, partial [Deltaproteobacteria bacterium]
DAQNFSHVSVHVPAPREEDQSRQTGSNLPNGSERTLPEEKHRHRPRAGNPRQVNGLKISTDKGPRSRHVSLEQ